ncbi:MAG TPA: TIGR04255 family protein [Tepidisphaeraceae bacterium]|nr:TIGR04255 family protein [Tepidisphaeraceae bacterium]
MPHYRKAPIIEALIDVQARLNPNTTAVELRRLVEEGDEEFPKPVELKKASFEVKFEEAQFTGGGTEEVTGWAFRSSDHKRVVQARTDGFTFSRLAPYEHWETLQQEARPLWERYRAIAAPEAVTRVAVKYINRFDIPLPIRDLKDFFRTNPEVSPDMPQGLAAFFMQLQIPYPDLESMLILTQTLVPPPQAGLVSVVLDIDLFRANNLPTSDEAIWQLLEQLREKKNEIFEACITDAARELIR